jgi:carboxylate-amine ligase
VTLTLGVEEEFLLVDTTGHLSSLGPFIAEVGGRKGEFQKELNRCQVEAATGVCRTPDELLTQLRELRGELACAAAGRGLRLVPSGCPLLAEDQPTEITANPRYQRMAEQFGATSRSAITCGCHVHVSIKDRATGVQLSNHLRPWLPVLLTLTANSPFDSGLDTRYCSWRYQRWSRWPSAGPPPKFNSAEDYESTVDTMLRSGALMDRGMVYWDIRLSEKQPTLEFRIGDVAATPEEATVLAVVVRGLVETALEAIADHRPAPELRDQILRANLWRASHDGVTGQSLHPVTGLLTPVSVQLENLLEHIRPALRAGAGDWDFATAGIAALREKGGGAERQRAEFERRHRMEDVIDMLARVPAEQGS